MGIAQQAIFQAGQYVPKTLRDTWMLRGFGALKVPVILYCMPTVLQLDDAACSIKIPLGWRTRNHYKSMYFGVLAVGADCASGLLAQHLAAESGKNVQLLFKDFHADFHRRATGDVVFTCPDGAKVSKLVARAAAAPERVNEKVTVIATVPSQSDEVVAEFTLTLSLKQAKSAK
jgi:acyl-coenzyme A thioesterase PaaI-like protein